MRGTSIAAGLTVAGLLLSGCSEGKKSMLDGPLAGLTEREICGLVRAQAIGDATGADVVEARPESTPAGKGNPPGMLTCRYRLDGGKDSPAQISTTVFPAYPGRDDVEELNRSFMDNDDKLHKYQRVDGLGLVAGYGADPMLADVVPMDALAVVFKAGGGRFKCIVEGQPGAALKQLKPLAVELLAGLQKELG
jgi:hypothetical protein